VVILSRGRLLPIGLGVDCHDPIGQLAWKVTAVIITSRS
jgi:hypothetical protein